MNLFPALPQTRFTLIAVTLCVIIILSDIAARGLGWDRFITLITALSGTIVSLAIFRLTHGSSGGDPIPIWGLISVFAVGLTLVAYLQLLLFNIGDGGLSLTLTFFVGVFGAVLAMVVIKIGSVLFPHHVPPLYIELKGLIGIILILLGLQLFTAGISIPQAEEPENIEGPTYMVDA